MCLVNLLMDLVNLHMDKARLGRRTYRSWGTVLKNPRGQRPCPGSTGHQGPRCGSCPNSCIAPPVTNRTVVFEQQRWKGGITGERHVRQGRGRPRKQYLIEWEPSWVDSARLAAPELIKDWEEKGREEA